MATITNIYSDIDLTFSMQPVSGDISLVLDSRSVINSVKSLLFTNFYERPWQPSLGSNLSGLLFEPISSITATTLQAEITNVISNFEPRVIIDYINVTSDELNDGYNITLSFFIGNNTQPTQVTTFLQRVR
jgi:phage baseplate assembly protein W